MKLLFVHGTKMKEDKNKDLYTGGSYNSEAWDRYLSITNKLSVIARKEKERYKAKEAEERFNYFDKNKINFIEIPNSSSLKSFFSLSERKKISNIIRDEVCKNDFIIARLPCVYGILAVKYAKQLNKPYLIEVVGCAWDSLWNHSFKGKLLAPLRYYGMKRAVLHAPYVVYVTGEFLQKRYPTKGREESCSNVSLSEFDDKIIESRMDRINIGYESKTIIVGTIGNVDIKYKGQQHIIKALGMLKKKGIINYEYHLVGGGNQAYLKTVAKRHSVLDNIKFLGSIPHDEVIKWLDNIDIYMQPSLTEGLPRGLIEAMSRGLPCIGSDVGGIPELLEEEFIFTNNRNNIDKIINIIKSYDKEVMLQQAKRNYEESKKYNKNIIEKRRRKFFQEFRESN